MSDAAHNGHTPARSRDHTITRDHTINQTCFAKRHTLVTLPDSGYSRVTPRDVCRRLRGPPRCAALPPCVRVWLPCRGSPAIVTSRVRACVRACARAAAFRKERDEDRGARVFAARVLRRMRDREVARTLRAANRLERLFGVSRRSKFVQKAKRRHRNRGPDAMSLTMSVADVPERCARQRRRRAVRAGAQ